jgi:hypothetical protein
LEQKIQESSEARFGTTYIFGGIALECGVVDLRIHTFVSINSAALEVVCPPPGVRTKKVQESSADHHSSTYHASAVALESAGIYLDIGTAGINNSTLLKLDVPRQELEQNFEKVLLAEYGRMEKKVVQMVANKQTYILRQNFDDPSKIAGAAVIQNRSMWPARNWSEILR